MAAEDEIRKDLEDILVKVAETENIENYKLIPNTKSNIGDGFVAQFYTGEIQNKDTGKTVSIAIKKAPAWEFDYNTIFKNEYLFYNVAFPTLDDLQNEINVSECFENVPKYICGSLDLKKEYIAMENLTPFGYVMFDKMQPFDKEHLELIFKTYGKFHALSFVLRSKNCEKYQNISQQLVDLVIMVAEALGKNIAISVPAAIKALDPEQDKVVYNEVQNFGENIVETFINSCKYNGQYRCLIHGDCWSNNMLFKYSNSGKLLDLKLLDFQLVRDGTPIHDLSYFFYSGASKKDFDNIDDYLRIYYKSLWGFVKELGGNPDELFSFDVLKSEWKENALFGLIMGICLWQIKLIPKEAFQDTAGKSVEETTKSWEALFQIVHTNDSFIERTTAILIHGVEYGVIKKG